MESLTNLQKLLHGGLNKERSPGAFNKKGNGEKAYKGSIFLIRLKSGRAFLYVVLKND